MTIFHAFRWTAGAAVFAVSCALLASPAAAKSFTLTIKDHRFTPETLHVPAGEEFESSDFHVEKVIAGGKQMTFHIGPLTAGTYGFFGERHEDTALGKLFAE